MRHRCIVVTLALCVVPATAQRIITTAVGTDWFLSVDGKIGTELPLSSEVLKITVDGQGNLYIPDALNHVIFQVARSGVTRIVAGNGIGAYSGDGGPATSASLNLPTAVAVD